MFGRALRLYRDIWAIDWNSHRHSRSLEQRLLSQMKVMQPLTVIDLAGSGGLARIGADGRLLTASHAVAQRWAVALRKTSG